MVLSSASGCDSASAVHTACLRVVWETERIQIEHRTHENMW